MQSPRFRAKKMRQSTGPRRVLIGLGGVLLILCLFLYSINAAFRPAVASSAKAVAMRVASEALNHALTEEIAHDADYDRIVHVERAPNGDVRIAHFDFAAVTKLQSAASDRAEAELRKLQYETLRLPLTQALNSGWLSGVGPTMPVHFYLVGSAHSSVSTEVQSVGINQTVHTLYLELQARVNVVAPFVTEAVVVESKMPIAYIVLGGSIPQTYVAGGPGMTSPWLPYSKNDKLSIR